MDFSINCILSYCKGYKFSLNIINFVLDKREEIVLVDAVESEMEFDATLARFNCHNFVLV